MSYNHLNKHQFDIAWILYHSYVRLYHAAITHVNIWLYRLLTPVYALTILFFPSHYLSLCSFTCFFHGNRVHVLLLAASSCLHFCFAPMFFENFLFHRLLSHIFLLLTFYMDRKKKKHGWLE